MCQQISGPTQSVETSALLLLERALQMLDQCDVPGNIGAYIDLAIWQLRETQQTAIDVQ